MLRSLQCCPIGFGLHEGGVCQRHHVPIICFHLQTRPHYSKLQYFYFILFYLLIYLIYLFIFILFIFSLKHNNIYANRTVVLRTEAQKRHFYTHSFELWLVPSSSIFQDLPWSSPLGLFSTTPLRCFVYPSLFFSLCWCFNLKDCDFVCGKNEFYDCYWFLLL